MHQPRTLVLLIFLLFKQQKTVYYVGIRTRIVKVKASTLTTTAEPCCTAKTKNGERHHKMIFCCSVPKKLVYDRNIGNSNNILLPIVYWIFILVPKNYFSSRNIVLGSIWLFLVQFISNVVPQFCFHFFVLRKFATWNSATSNFPNFRIQNFFHFLKKF